MSEISCKDYSHAFLYSFSFDDFCSLSKDYFDNIEVSKKFTS